MKRILAWLQYLFPVRICPFCDGVGIALHDHESLSCPICAGKGKL